MIRIGELNELRVLHRNAFGLLLEGEDKGEILLPTALIPEDLNLDDLNETLEVFICYDSTDRLIATLEMPYVMVGEFERLQVVATESVGNFLDWGLAKHLFLPFAETTRELRVGDEVIVTVYLDKSGRISASMRLDRYLEKTGEFEPNEAVELLIAAKTDLGYKAIINDQCWGVLYQNEVFQPLQYGQRLRAFIKHRRDDGKIDLTLLQPGHKAAIGDIGPKIIELLEKEGGFLEISDKTPAEKIYDLFGVSKKKYKIALGDLYKRRLISVEENGIRLVR